MKTVLLFFVCGVLMLSTVRAQSGPEFDKAAAEMEKLMQWYKASPVSFDIRYTYTNEHTPGKVLDSVKGWVEMNGDRFRSKLDSTETIHNGKYNIVLFGEDKMMYLSADSSAAVDPVKQFQKMLTSAGATGCTLTHDHQFEIVRVNYSDNSACRYAEFTIDTVKKNLTMVKYLVKTAALMDGSKDAPDGYEPYALVCASMYNYKPLANAAARFDERSFFYKEGGAFKVTPAYSDYKIFVGSPKLYE
jgi:hypothetical protein